DVLCYPFAMKPLPKTYRRIIKDIKVSKQHIAVLGDQLMTDVLGANMMGLHTILTAQAVERDLSFTKVNRIAENIVFKLLKVTKKLTKGEFDE
ncbi:MAG: HAD hydrolase-like protein, partial [Longicatena sp.]